MNSTIYVLDACAVISLIKKETGWETVLDILSKSIKGEAVVFIHEINLLEIYYGFRKEKGKEYAEQKISEMSPFFTIIKGLTDVAFAEAGRLKASYKISLADSIALAETSISVGTLLTADHHEFDAVEKNEEIHFQWIR